MDLYKMYMLIFWNLQKFIPGKILLNKKLHKMYIILYYIILH